MAASAGANDLPASLATASSDGTIKLWDTRKLGGGSGGGAAASGADAAAPAVCTAHVSSGARITCLAAVDPDQVVAARTKPATPAAAAAGSGKKAAAAAAASGDAKPAEKKVSKAGLGCSGFEPGTCII